MVRRKFRRLLFTLTICFFIFLATVWYPKSQDQLSSAEDVISPDIYVEPLEKNQLLGDHYTDNKFEQIEKTLELKSAQEKYSLKIMHKKHNGKFAVDKMQSEKSTINNQAAIPTKQATTQQFHTASGEDLLKGTISEGSIWNAAQNLRTSSAKTSSVWSNSTAENKTSAPSADDSSNNVHFSVNAKSKESTQSSKTSDPLLDIWYKQIMRYNKRPNILFIIADDMRPDIGFYNKYFSQRGSTWLNQKMHTPFLDNLATESLVFSRAYSQQAWCNPSRSSFLTSRRPDTTMVHNNTVYFRQNNPNFVTLPQFFKNKGYFTAAYGKVFHKDKLCRGCSDDAYSWSQPTRIPLKDEVYSEPPGIKALSEKDLKEFQLMDQFVTTDVKKFLDDFAGHTSKTPFFLAMGLKKPHLPFVFPARFLEKYPLSNITMPPNPIAAKDMPHISWFKSFEFRDLQNYKPFSETWTMEQALPIHVIKTIRQGYYACISYIDDLIGQVLEKLKSRGFKNNTIVVFIGDHGYHLGEQSIIGKNTAFEVAANAPMMIRIPGVTDKGFRTEQLAEFVDIFPTLVELAGFPKLPSCPEYNSRAIDLCTEGSSLVPLFRTTMPKHFRWKDSIFYQYPHVYSETGAYCIGYTIRTVQFRFTEWNQYLYKLKDNPLKNSIICGVELYDHLNDPNETINIASSHVYRDTVSKLSEKLRQGWAQAMPSVTG